MALADKVLAEALDLPTEARARIAHELLRSLDEETEEGGDVIQEWTDEISRRLQEVIDGSVELVSLDEMKRRTAAYLAGRAKNR